MSRFDPTNAELRASLQWHASITAELQQRILEAASYARRKGLDPELGRLLDGRQATTDVGDVDLFGATA